MIEASFKCEKCGTNLDEFRMYYNQCLCLSCYDTKKKVRMIRVEGNKIIRNLLRDLNNGS